MSCRRSKSIGRCKDTIIFLFIALLNKKVTEIADFRYYFFANDLVVSGFFRNFVEYLRYINNPSNSPFKTSKSYEQNS
jgi:hypothetical protein